MAAPRQYSTLFTCIHDEPGPVGGIGRGTHYSVFRAVEWLDVERRPLAVPQIHDFAVIWDEDHDVRVIEAVERIYMAGLLSPVQFVGERKGFLTALAAARFYFLEGPEDLEAYREAVEAITQGLDDAWPAEVGSFDRSPGSSHQCIYGGLISDDDHRVGLYLGAIDALWRLGTRPYRPAPPPAPPPGMPHPQGTMPPFRPAPAPPFPPRPLPPRG